VIDGFFFQVWSLWAIILFYFIVKKEFLMHKLEKLGMIAVDERRIMKMQENNFIEIFYVFRSFKLCLIHNA
jgi:hypothetical protein